MTTIGYRDGKPAICVKDRTLWARDPRVREPFELLDERVIDAIYEGVREDFWHDIAPDVAREHGYSGKVYSAGRSGGWLILGDSFGFLDYLNSDDPWSGKHDAEDCAAVADYTVEGYAAVAVVERDRFVAFASAIGAAVSAAGEAFVERLHERVKDDAHEISERAYWAARDVVTMEA